MPVGHFLRALVSQNDSGSGVLTLARGGHVVATTIELAGDSAARKRGLLDRDHLPEDTALVIAPCSAVHTFGMRFSIDVIFAARDGRVLKIARDLGPHRLAAAWGAFAAIEMAAGEASRHGVNVGDYVTVKTTSGVVSPDS
jgi:uncharacterized membrane protein (UPF0127 family)